MELAEWVEKAALENLKGHLQNSDHLFAQSSTTLTILLTGGGASMAYVVQAIDKDIASASVIAAGSLAVYFFGLCGVLVVNCMMLSEFPQLTNEPKHLYQEEFSLEKLRKVELRNCQERIEQAADRNYCTAKWLNRVRIAALLSPVWALVVTSLAGAVLLF